MPLPVGFHSEFRNGKRLIRPKEAEELHGTWVNIDYNTVPGLAAKRIFNPDGTWAKYERIETDIWISGPFSITDKWTDREENIWYKVETFHPRTGNYYVLARISNSGRILECTCSVFDYPTALESNSYSGNHQPIVEYSIYYRQ